MFQSHLAELLLQQLRCRLGSVMGRIAVEKDDSLVFAQMAVITKEDGTVALGHHGRNLPKNFIVDDFLAVPESKYHALLLADTLKWDRQRFLTGREPLVALVKISGDHPLFVTSDDVAQEAQLANL
ncbi:hypothetical protein KIN20_031256 [Parelaphostrongylus tenuis]|uniref:Uncharacterized protein n=1 Tax=Parelaphostrongylus tenuis TaxID=148309 RepID=A0AAD5R5A4_PARTN|nr:hypothetical protein KIN20_031256 [Parelaphostrongylus tenuis]